MDVTIIGTGNMARGIGTRVIAGGHELTLLGTEQAKAESLAEELAGGTKAGTVGDPLTGDVVVLAVPYTALSDVVARYGEQLDGKVVVDVTNPVDFATFEPIAVAAGSAAQEIAAARENARVVKAFNTTFASTLVAGSVAGQQLDVLVASDDDDAKRTVAQLVEDGGLRPIDAGPLRRAHELEELGYLHMAVQESLGTGFASGVKVVSGV
jgi:8-hydroxy-5-deazaflavin:NADPH oxidoreductase